MSFFDEVEETRVEPPAADRSRRAGGGGRRPPGNGRRASRGRSSGGGRRTPPGNEQAIRVRRAVALVALVIVVILIVLGVHSCQVSATNSALRNYNDTVASLIKASNQTGQRFFTLLSSGQGANNAPALQSQIAAAKLTAESQLSQAKGMDVPDQVRSAQQNLLLALQMRLDGISNIASHLQPALQPSTAQGAINSIATEMARFYASDVLYKDYALPSIVSALHSAGIEVGGANGEPVAGGQFLPDLQWLTPTYVSSQLRVSLPAASGGGKAAPGVHGHSLDSCSVGGTTLQPGVTTTIPTNPAPTFTCTVTNDGQNTENNVVVKATVTGTSVGGQATIPQTKPGQQYTVQVPLGSSPSRGTYNVNVTVQHVPGETTFTHNTKIYSLTFQ